MVISTGTTVPIILAVRALYSLQKAIIFKPCWPRAGPTGGAGLALPAWICSLTTAFTFLAILTNPPPQIITAQHYCRARIGRWLHPFNLQKVYFYWRLAAKHADQHAHAGAVGINGIHCAHKVLKRSLDDAHFLPFSKADLDLGRFGFHALEDFVDFFLAQRNGLGARPHEIGHARSIAHHIPGVVVHYHFDEDVAGEDAPLGSPALSVSQLHLFLGWHDHLENLVLHPHRLDAVLQILFDFVLVSGVAVNDVPSRIGVARRGFLSSRFS